MSTPRESTAAREGARWLTPRFLLVLFVQAFFSLGWSTFFLVPEFFTERFGLTGGAILSLNAVASIGALLAVPVVGYGLDRFGQRPFVAMGSAMVAVAAFGFSVLDRVGPAVYALLLLEGIGFVFAWNAAAALAADLAPPDRVGRVIGIFGAANLSMNAIAPWLGEELAGAYGWSAPFLVAGATCSLAVVLAGSLPETRVDRGPAAARPALVEMFDAGMLRVFAGAALFAVSFTAVFALQAPYAHLHGVTDVSDFFVGFTAAALTTRVFLGGLVDRHGPGPVSAVAMTAYALAPLSLLVLGPTHLALAGATLGACHGVLFPAVMALAVERSDPSARGAAMTLTNGAFNVGSIAAGFVLGAAADRFGYGAAFVCASLATLAGAAITAARPPARRAPSAVGKAVESAR